MNAGLMREVASWAFWRMAAAAALVAITAAAASAQYCTPDQCDECDLCNARLSCCHEPPELWLVNTRCLPRCSNLDQAFERISIKRWDPSCRRFVSETVDSLIAQEANMPTLFFAHGNTLKHKGAMKQCWKLYNKMRCCPGKKRLVFWSWPAQIAFKRPLLRPRKLIMKNLRIKFVYSEYQGYYMAKILERMSFTQRVTAGGHSYGAIIGASAAHYLGGGSLRGLTLAGGMPVQRNFRVMNISGAFDNDAMDPGKRYGQSFVAAEKVLNTRNKNDSTLDNWPKVSLRGRRAIGVTGINANNLGEYSSKLCQITMSREVGKSHYIDEHLSSRRLVNLMCCIAFPECAACAMAQQQGDAPPAVVEPIDEPVPAMPATFSAGHNSGREQSIDEAYAGDDDGPVLRLLRGGR